jgi:LemA protein
VTTVTQVLAILFLVLIAAAAIAALSIAHRQRSVSPLGLNRSAAAADLIALEEELNYAEALAEPDSVTAANLARAHRELNLAFVDYNRQSAVSGEALSSGDADAISARLAIVREILADPETPRGNSVASHDTSVIVNTQLAPTVTTGSRVFEVTLWVLGLAPGLIFMWQKQQVRNYFVALEQRIRANAAQIDVYLAQRAQILANCPGYLPEMDLGLNDEGRNEDGRNDEGRNITNGRIDRAYQEILARAQGAAGGNGGVISPELKSALRADRTVQREITAARTLYNDSVNMWNRDIFEWPAKMIVAADAKLTTRPVFVGSRLGTSTDLTRSR